MAVVQAQGLGRSYGAFRALSDVSFEIQSGEIVGLLGPNGAGKSTTMKILTGYIAPTSGAATVCGHDVLEAPLEVRRHIGYLPESAPIYGDMTVRPYLDFIGRARGLGAAERSRAIDRVGEECGLMDRMRQRISTLSRGYKQRVGLAQALLHGPDLLILDEPTNGLDPNQIVEIRNIVRAVGETRTVILSTHILSEVEATCDRVLIINQGQLVADGPVSEVVDSTSGHRVSVGLAASKIQSTEEELVKELESIEGVTRVEPVSAKELAFRFVVFASEDVRASVFGWAAARGHTLVELHGEGTNLETVFRELTLANREVEGS